MNITILVEPVADNGIIGNKAILSEEVKNDYTVVAVDNLDNSVVCEEADLTIDDKTFTAKFGASKLNSTADTFKVIVTRSAYTKYTMTDIPKAELDGLDIGKVEIYPGDLNGDGKVDGIDGGIYSRNKGKQSIVVSCNSLQQ